MPEWLVKKMAETRKSRQSKRLVLGFVEREVLRRPLAAAQ